MSSHIITQIHWESYIHKHTSTHTRQNCKNAEKKNWLRKREIGILSHIMSLELIVRWLMSCQLSLRILNCEILVSITAIAYVNTNLWAVNLHEYEMSGVNKNCRYGYADEKRSIYLFIYIFCCRLFISMFVGLHFIVTHTLARTPFFSVVVVVFFSFVQCDYFTLFAICWITLDSWEREKRDEKKKKQKQIYE